MGICKNAAMNRIDERILREKGKSLCFKMKQSGLGNLGKCGP
jgi:hypothetical protein